MAHDSILLPCNGDGLCMACKASPPEEEKLTCKTCVTPWHVACLRSLRPEDLASTLQWECPDCSGHCAAVERSEPATDQGSLVAAIRAIEADESLTEREKAAKRQRLVSGKKEGEAEKEKKGKNVLDILSGTFNCSVCIQLMDRPVTTPCGHNFCLKCFEKWIGQGKRTCAKCRTAIPAKMASQPRINSSLVAAIRMAKMSDSTASRVSHKIYQYVQNEDRPEKAYTTDRAKKTGKSNAASGKIFVTIPPDHFGPITAENDPERNQGVLVGECWEDRLECRQWGAHFPHVAGIAGQSEYGAQSVALSGGYQDDEDHGEWFLYTGSGGRDLSGNKRTNKEQSFDQKFDKSNEALRVSCRNGYPVRVVRSHKEKRSAYAPEKGVRYDGIYRIEKCWRKLGIQGFKVCRYLFVRCDNEPAPWTSDENGDVPRPLPSIPELKKASDIMERKESPSWDFDTEDGCWKWKRSPPISKRSVNVVNPEDRKKIRKAIRQSQNTSIRERLLKEFSCLICKKVMTLPLTTPCAHNFCKSCLEGTFAGMTFVQERKAGGRSLRSRKNVLKCPCCPTDISDFLQDPQVNREMMDLIESLKEKEETGDPVQESSEDEAEDMEENPEKSTDSGKQISQEIDGNGDDNSEDINKAKGETVECSVQNDGENKTRQEMAVTSDGVNKVSLKRKKPDGVNNSSSSELDVAKRSRIVSDALDEDNHQSPSSPLHVLSEDDCE